MYDVSKGVFVVLEYYVAISNIPLLFPKHEEIAKHTNIGQLSNNFKTNTINVVKEVCGVIRKSNSKKQTFTTMEGLRQGVR